ncbi:MAG: hypothetical protein QOH59_519 [Gemmatimonadales bacterium]|jgi:hypothetical protein|nr:hypothetical protein [Gemmatimonadales bacterium]
MDLPTAIVISSFLLPLSVTAGLFIARKYLGSYLVAKGTNLATKEDIQHLTTLVESVKAEYAGELERLKSALLKEVESHRIRYATELEMYKRIWTAAHRLFVTANALHVPSPNASADELKIASDSRRDYHKAAQAYEDELWELRPFYPDEVYKELWELGHVLASTLGPGFTQVPSYVELVTNRHKLLESIERTCETIRRRLRTASQEMAERPDR